MADTAKPNRYSQLIEAIFMAHYKKGNTEVVFDRDELVGMAKRLRIVLPKNLGDITYTFRYRGFLPAAILNTSPLNKMWVIRSAGKGRYKFALVPASVISPSPNLVETKIPDATPGVITKYSMGDEQALLARIRYNRLIDVFTGLTCYSLQNHLRTTVPGMGQLETDEIYIGLDKRGVHYVLPVQAKGTKERFGVVQIEQDIAMCGVKFPDLLCRAVAAQFIKQDVIALFELEQGDDTIKTANERHYRLVKADDLSSEELKQYQQRPL